MTHLFSHAMNPAILGVLALFVSIVWMLRDEDDKTRPWLVLAFILNLFYGTALNIFMGGEGRLFRFKYDYILFHLDTVMGIPSTPVARALQGSIPVPLWWAYEMMIPMMICWLIINRHDNSRGSVTLAFVAELIAGPVFYSIVPACGPVYAFRASWLHPQKVSASLTPLAGQPNAFPSLHMATALVLAFFARGKIWRSIALVFLAATCMATLSTGEHYVIDLFAGLAFGCFAAYVGFRKYRLAAASLGVSLLCSFAVRFGYDFLTKHRLVLQSAAILIFIFAAFSVVRQWSVTEITLLDDLVEDVEVVCSPGASSSVSNS